MLCANPSITQGIATTVSDSRKQGDQVEIVASGAGFDVGDCVAKFGQRVVFEDIVSGAACHGVLAVPADKAVVAGFAEYPVLVVLAIQRIIAVLATNPVISAAAIDGVVAGSADQRILCGSAIEGIVPSVAEQ